MFHELLKSVVDGYPTHFQVLTIHTPVLLLVSLGVKFVHFLGVVHFALLVQEIVQPIIDTQVNLDLERLNSNVYCLHLKELWFAGCVLTWF